MKRFKIQYKNGIYRAMYRWFVFWFPMQKPIADDLPWIGVDAEFFTLQACRDFINDNLHLFVRTKWKDIEKM